MLHYIERGLQKFQKAMTWKCALRFILALFFLALFACFFDWLIINWLSRCCDGGVCIPEWFFPQCHADGGHHAY